MASSSSTSTLLTIAEKHNLVAYLLKPKESQGFQQIIDFLTRSSLKEALTINPIIILSQINDFWTSAQKTEENGVVTIVGKVADQQIKITEETIRTHLLLQDADGITCYSVNSIYDQLVLLGYEGERSNKLTFYKSFFSSQWKYLIHTLQQCISQKRTSFDQFSSNIASAIICLANNQMFNFSKMIFTGMLYNLDHSTEKFLMYPRFLQHIFNKQIPNLPCDGGKLILSSHTKKLFANMRRISGIRGVLFSGKVTPLTSHMLNVNPIAEVAHPSSTSVPTDETVSTPSTDHPTSVASKSRRTRDPKPSKQKAKKASNQASETPLSQVSQSINLNEVVNEGVDDHVGRAATTVSTPEGVQDSGNIDRTQPTATLNTEVPLVTSNAEVPLVTKVSSGPRTKKRGAHSVHARHDTLGGSSDPSKEVNTSRDGEDSSLLQDLTNTCTKLCGIVEKQWEEIHKLKRKMKRMNREIQNLKVDKSKAKSKSEGLKRLVKAGRAQIVETSESSSSSDKDQNEHDYMYTGAVEGNESNLFRYDSMDTATHEAEPDEQPILGTGLFADVLPDDEMPAASSTQIGKDELTAAEALIKVAKAPSPIKSATPRSMGISFRESGPERLVPEAEKEGSKDKGKGILIEPVKPMKKKELEAYSEQIAKQIQDEWNAEEDLDMVNVEVEAGIVLRMSKDEQISFDHVLAQKSTEAEWNENTPEQRQVWLENFLAKRRTAESHKKYKDKQEKPLTRAQQKEQYVRCLKNSTGLTMSVLRKMSFESLKARYEAEKRFVADGGKISKPTQEEVIRTEAEIKGIHDKKYGTELASYSRKRKSSNNAFDGMMKRLKESKRVEDDVPKDVHTDVPSSVDNKEEKDGELDMDRLRKMVEIDETKYTPLAVEYPIIDWYMHTDINMKKSFMVVRAGNKEEFYKGFWSMVTHFSRDDLNKMWEIGQKKYANADRYSDEKIIYDLLALMFEPNAEMEYFTQMPSDIYSWYLFAHNGVHMVIHKNGTAGYFLADYNYPFHIKMLKQMISFKVKCRDVDLAAYLVDKMEKLLDIRIKEYKKNEAEILRRASPAIREQILKALRKT